jgi:hypothetical protein
MCSIALQNVRKKIKIARSLVAMPPPPQNIKEKRTCRRFLCSFSAKAMAIDFVSS